jgi:hypothetical protein
LRTLVVIFQGSLRYDWHRRFVVESEGIKTTD